MKTLLLTTIVSLGLLTTSCYPKKEAANTANKSVSDDCPKDLMCTMDYRMLSIQVVDGNDRPYLLDTYKTLVDGKEVVLSKMAQEPIDVRNFKGYYVIAEDGNMATLGKKGKEVTFVGLKGGREVVKHTMVIGHDCCHIQLKSGTLKAVVQ